MTNSIFYFFSTSPNSFQDYKSVYTSDYTKSPLKINKLWDSHVNSTPLGEDEIPDLKHFIATKHPLDFENPYEGLIQGFNLSNRAFEVVSKFKISGHNIVPIPYLYKKKEYTSVFLHLFENKWNAVSMEKSKHAIVKSYPPMEKIFEDNLVFYNDSDKYHGKVEGGKRVIAKEEIPEGARVAISKFSIAPSILDYDFFPIYRGTIYSHELYFISERLKSALESEGFTGMQFSECNMLIIE